MLVFDLDHNADLVCMKQQLGALSCAYLIYSTHSHLRETDNNPDAEPRYRVIIPLAEPVPAEVFSSVWHNARQKTGLPVDDSAKDLCRMYYLPAIATYGSPFKYYEHPGEPLDWHGLSLTNENEAVTFSPQKQIDSVDCITSPRNPKLFVIAKKLYSEGISRENVETSLLQINETRCRPPHEVAKVKEIVRNAERYPIQGGMPNPLIATLESKPLQIINAALVAPREIEWLWYPYIPKNYVTLFSGEEGVGKSWVFCAIASGITNGFLPLGDRFKPQNVLIFSAEDAADDALVPRLIKCGANLERVSIVNERFTFDEMGMLRVQLCIAETNPAWVVIDPLFSYSDTRLDLNKPHHARRVTTSFELIAKKFGIAISYLIHFNKSKGQGDARAAVSSSQEFSNAARSIILIGKDPTNEDRRALVHKKHNYSPKGRSIGYQIIGGEGGAEFFWRGESTMTERELVDRAGSSDEHAQKTEAVEFLRDVLRDGERDAGEIISLAKAVGLSEQQLRTGRSKLGITPYSTGFGKDKKWFWKLPETVNTVSKYSDQHLSSQNGHKSNVINDFALDVENGENQHLNGLDVETSNSQHLNGVDVNLGINQHLKVTIDNTDGYSDTKPLDVDSNISLPIATEVKGIAQGKEYGTCDCGMPAFIGKPCPRCGVPVFGKTGCSF
ncbi:MAG: AAA family ATPase [Pyrinomonadaceae bacterium]